MFFHCLFEGRCLERNVVSEPFANSGCFYGSTVLALRKYATLSKNWSTACGRCGGAFYKSLNKSVPKEIHFVMQFTVLVDLMKRKELKWCPAV
jgi:hypothetical protein